MGQKLFLMKQLTCKKPNLPTNIQKLFKSMVSLPLILNICHQQSKILSMHCKYVGKSSQNVMLTSAKKNDAINSVIIQEGNKEDCERLQSIHT